MVIQGDCKWWVLISVSFFVNAVSYKSKKIKSKVSYALSRESSGKTLSHFIFLVVSIFSLGIPRLIEFVFQQTCFICLQGSVAKWSLLSVLIIPKYILFSKTLFVKIWSIAVAFILVALAGLTAQKTFFRKPWNIMESSKRPSKYHLFINLLAEKNAVFLITEKFKTRTIQ